MERFFGKKRFLMLKYKETKDENSKRKIWGKKTPKALILICVSGRRNEFEKERYTSSNLCLKKRRALIRERERIDKWRKKNRKK